jgi:hypothetical protein
MDARRFAGQKTVSLWVSFGPNYVSSTLLCIKANSRADIALNPGRVEFDPVAFGQTPSQTIDVEYAGKLAWQVTKVTVPARAPFDASVKETYRREGKVGYQVTVKLKAGAAPGPYWENLLLETNDPDAPRLPLPVQATIQWPREVVNLGKVKAGEALTRQVEVRGSRPFLVLGIEGPGGVCLESEPNTKASAAQKLTLRLSPVRGKFSYEVSIKTDLQEASRVVVMIIEGVAPPPPEEKLTPAPPHTAGETSPPPPGS